MSTYVIEREFPGAGALTAAQLQEVSQTSCDALAKLGPDIRWVQSYVTDDKIYCIYNAGSEGMVREHARLGGFPANVVSAVHAVIGPDTARAVA